MQHVCWYPLSKIWEESSNWMETPDDNHCHTTGIESSVAFQHENQKHLSRNSQPESDVVQCSSDAVARGLSSTLATVIQDFDSRAQDTLRSQDQLSSALDRLTRGFWLFISFFTFYESFEICDMLLICVLNQFISMNWFLGNRSESNWIIQSTCTFIGMYICGY